MPYTKNVMLYPNLEAELKRYEITKDDLAKVIGVSRTNVYTRLTGKKELTLNEARIICAYVEKVSGRPMTLKYLFNFTA